MLPPKIDEPKVVVVPLFLWQQHLHKEGIHGFQWDFNVYQQNEPKGMHK